jgi:predicted nucleic acid-binding protein
LIVYVETSAAVKLLLREEQSTAVMSFLDEAVASDHALVSSSVLETELRRTAIRRGISQEAATAVLERFDIFDLERSVFTQAGILPGPTLRSLDALHIAAALRISAELMVSYDARQIEAAESVGLHTISPE